jgi:hypothetical protein
MSFAHCKERGWGESCNPHFATKIIKNLNLRLQQQHCAGLFLFKQIFNQKINIFKKSHNLATQAKFVYVEHFNHLTHY